MGSCISSLEEAHAQEALKNSASQQSSKRSSSTAASAELRKSSAAKRPAPPQAPVPKAEVSPERTPLMLAAEHNQAETTTFLLNQGADPWAVEAEGLTALHLACRHGHPAVISALLDGVPEGVQQRQRYMELATKAGLTPLRLAIMSGSSDACKVLIRYGPSFHSVAPPAAERPVWLERLQGLPKAGSLMLPEQDAEHIPPQLSIRDSFPSSAKKPFTSSVILPMSTVFDVPEPTVRPIHARGVIASSGCLRDAWNPVPLRAFPSLAKLAGRAHKKQLQRSLASVLQQRSKFEDDSASNTDSERPGASECEVGELSPPLSDCPVCCDNPAAVQLRPCGHELCGNCTSQVVSWQVSNRPAACPLCAQPVADLVAVQSA